MIYWLHLLFRIITNTKLEIMNKKKNQIHSSMIILTIILVNSSLFSRSDGNARESIKTHFEIIALKIRTSNWVVFQYLDWIKLIPSERASSEHVRHIIFFSVDYIMFCDRSIWNKWLFVKHEKLKNALKILSRSDGKESARDIQMGIISGISFEWVGEYNV